MLKMFLKDFQFFQVTCVFLLSELPLPLPPPPVYTSSLAPNPGYYFPFPVDLPFLSSGREGIKGVQG